MISARLATLNELQTTLGVQDLYDLLEVIAVDRANQLLATRKEDK